MLPFHSVFIVSKIMLKYELRDSFCLLVCECSTSSIPCKHAAQGMMIIEKRKGWDWERDCILSFKQQYEIYLIKSWWTRRNTLQISIKNSSMSLSQSLSPASKFPPVRSTNSVGLYQLTWYQLRYSQYGIHIQYSLTIFAMRYSQTIFTYNIHLRYLLKNLTYNIRLRYSQYDIRLRYMLKNLAYNICLRYSQYDIRKRYDIHIQNAYERTIE